MEELSNLIFQDSVPDMVEEMARIEEEQVRIKDFVISKKEVLQLLTIFKKEVKAKEYEHAVKILSFIQYLIQNNGTNDNLRAFVLFGTVQKIRDAILYLRDVSDPTALETLNEIFTGLDYIIASSEKAKKDGNFLFPPLLDFVLADSVVIRSAGAKEVSETCCLAVNLINVLLERCRENAVAFKNSCDFPVIMPRLFKLLFQASEYPFQAVLVEVIYRLVRGESDLRKLLGATKEQTDEFLKLTSSTFLESTRTFLAYVNTSLGKAQRVFSFSASKISINGLDFNATQVDFGTFSFSFWVTSTESMREFQDRYRIFVRVFFSQIEGVTVSSGRLAFIIDENAEVVNEIPPVMGKNKIELDLPSQQILSIDHAIFARIKAETNNAADFKTPRKASRAVFISPPSTQPSPVPPAAIVATPTSDKKEKGKEKENEKEREKEKGGDSQDREAQNNPQQKAKRGRGRPPKKTTLAKKPSKVTEIVEDSQDEEETGSRGFKQRKKKVTPTRGRGKKGQQKKMKEEDEVQEDKEQASGNSALEKRKNDKGKANTVKKGKKKKEAKKEIEEEDSQHESTDRKKHAKGKKALPDKGKGKGKKGMQRKGKTNKRKEEEEEIQEEEQVKEKKRKRSAKGNAASDDGSEEEKEDDKEEEEHKAEEEEEKEERETAKQKKRKRATKGNASNSEVESQEEEKEAKRAKGSAREKVISSKKTGTTALPSRKKAEVERQRQISVVQEKEIIRLHQQEARRLRATMREVKSLAGGPSASASLDSSQIDEVARAMTPKKRKSEETESHISKKRGKRGDDEDKEEDIIESVEDALGLTKPSRKRKADEMDEKIETTKPQVATVPPKRGRGRPKRVVAVQDTDPKEKENEQNKPTVSTGNKDSNNDNKKPKITRKAPVESHLEEPVDREATPQGSQKGNNKTEEEKLKTAKEIADEEQHNEKRKAKTPEEEEQHEEVKETQVTQKRPRGRPRKIVPLPVAPKQTYQVKKPKQLEATTKPAQEQPTVAKAQHQQEHNEGETSSKDATPEKQTKPSTRNDKNQTAVPVPPSSPDDLQLLKKRIIVPPVIVFEKPSLPEKETNEEDDMAQTLSRVYEDIVSDISVSLNSMVKSPVLPALPTFEFNLSSPDLPAPKLLPISVSSPSTYDSPSEASSQETESSTQQIVKMVAVLKQKVNEKANANKRKMQELSQKTMARLKEALQQVQKDIARERVEEVDRHKKMISQSETKMKDNLQQLKELYLRFKDELEEKKQAHEVLWGQYENEISDFNIKMAALEVKQQEKFMKMQEKIKKDKEKLARLAEQAQKDNEGMQEFCANLESSIFLSRRRD